MCGKQEKERERKTNRSIEPLALSAEFKIKISSLGFPHLSTK
jgi:hypothetical protein